MSLRTDSQHHWLRRTAKGLTTATLLAVAAAPLGAATKERQGPAPLTGESLTVVSWGGPYAKAQKKAFFDAFTAETGIRVRMDDFFGGLAQVRAQVETGSIHWDLIDLEFADVAQGCEEGLLELVDIDELPPAPDGTLARDDYFEGSFSDCGGAGIFFSTIYAYNRESFPAAAPSKIEDFFDLKKFPGRRGLRRSPLVNLEFALLADGVPAAEVYAVLDTAAGRARAFRKLDSIKDQVLWWDTGAQPVQMLADHEVVMATSFNGRIFHEAVVERQPFVIVWDGQVLDSGQFAIVAGTPRLAAAKKLLLFLSRIENMAVFTRYFPYSPMRHSATKLISTHLETGVDMWPHMPTNPANMGRVLVNDWHWWRDHHDEMTERFSAWLLR